MSAWSVADNVIVNVEAMIGEATLVREHADGKQESIVVPTGKATQNDPGTGQTLLTPATVPNKVNEVVQAIAASSPDSNNQQPTEDGCSQGNAPHRLSPQPEHDEAAAAALAAELKAMSSGELMMVMAVLINNANHLCIDATTVADTVALISRTRPEEAGNVVFVASLLDPENSARYTDAALKAAPAQARNIGQAKDDADKLKQDFGADIPPRTSPKPPPAKSKPPIKPERDVPPGGTIGKPPSPE
jgi:hypothetical protein